MTAVRVIVIESQCIDAPPLKGTSPTLEMAENSRYINPRKENNTGVDTVVILGHMQGCDEYQLLLAHFFVKDPIVGNEFSDYGSILSTTTIWEAWRSGGSNGKIELTDSFWKFLANPSTCPRNGMGVIVLPFPDHWRMMYLSPYSTDCKMCVVKYKQPHQGGQVTKKKNLLTEHPKIRAFAMSKLVCASILRLLSMDYGVTVATEAVEREIKHGNDSLSSSAQGEKILDHFAFHHSHYTLVTHAVGFHIDKGKGMCTSFLENRVVLSSKRNEKEPNIPTGRSFVKKNYFEYALLDW